VRAGAIADLTAHQHRKPLLGDGAAVVGIAAPPLGDATLLVASDGLWRFADRAAIAACASRDGDALVSLVRQRHGELLDDVSVILVRAP
jgi:hypothetical protein